MATIISRYKGISNWRTEESRPLQNRIKLHFKAI
jgi:hypothetical protein